MRSVRESCSKDRSRLVVGTRQFALKRDWLRKVVHKDGDADVADLVCVHGDDGDPDYIHSDDVVSVYAHTDHVHPVHVRGGVGDQVCVHGDDNVLVCVRSDDTLPRSDTPNPRGAFLTDTFAVFFLLKMDWSSREDLCH